MQCVAVCCSVLQCVAVCCSVLQCVAVPSSQTTGMSLTPPFFLSLSLSLCLSLCLCLSLSLSRYPIIYYDDTATLQLTEITAAHCNTLQHTATHDTLSYIHYDDTATLQHTATHYSTLQHTATHCNTLQHTATHCNTLQHTVTHYRTLQHTATHCNTLHHIHTLHLTVAYSSGTDPPSCITNTSQTLHKHSTMTYTQTRYSRPQNIYMIIMTDTLQRHTLKPDTPSPRTYT